MLAFGGLWERWKAPGKTVLRTYTIITTVANRDMEKLHDRMPLVLDEADWAGWLGDDAGEAAALMLPAPSGTLPMWAVPRDVNSVQDN